MSLFAFFSEHKNSIEALESAFKISAIVVGGIWTYMLFVRRRQKYPRAKLEHKISVWPLSDEKILLRVTALVQNEGEVLLSLCSGFTWVQQVKPLAPDIQKAISAGVDPVKPMETEVQWPMLQQHNLRFERGEREIEPKESDEFQFDFVLDRQVETVLVYTYLKNLSKRFRIKHWKQRVKEIGWNLTTEYDIRPVLTANPNAQTKG